MTFSAPVQIMDSDIWGHIIPLPQDIGEMLNQDKNRRIICVFNEIETTHSALMHDGNGGFFITIQKALCKKLGIGLGEDIHIEISKDNSKYGMPMPEELGELLEMDEEGDRYFHALTPGKQRALIHQVGKYKQSDTRLRKAVVIVDFLKQNGGKMDFKLLNVAFKERKGI